MKATNFFVVFFASVLLSFSAFCQESYDSAFLSSLSKKAYDLYLNKPDSAIKQSSKLLQKAQQTKSLYHEGYCYLILSKAFWVKANYRMSTEYGFKAVKAFENSPHKKELSLSLLGLARTLSELGNYTVARELIGKAHALAQQEADFSMQADAYRELSFLLVELNKIDSGLLYADKGIALYEKLGDTLNASILYGRKSRIYFKLNDIEKSNQFAYRALAIDSMFNNMRGVGIEYLQVAKNQYALHHNDQAIKFVKRSIKISEEIGNMGWLMRAHDLLSQVYLEEKKYALASEELSKVSKYKDTLYNAEKGGQIQEMQSLYELEGKERRIELLGEENALKATEAKNNQLFMIILLAGIFLLILVIFLLTRLRSLQGKVNAELSAKNIAIEQQKEEMQAQAEKLHQLNQLKTKLFSVIGHDLRGPIANLHSLLELFTKQLMTAEEIAPISEKLRANLNITQRTLENLLNWSLSQMDGIKVNFKPIELKNAVEEAEKLLTESAERKNISMVNEFTENIIAFADPNQLQLVLRNLIHNAIKFSSIDKAIFIKATNEGEYCRIMIKDSGIGMTQEEIDIISGSKEHFTKSGTLSEKGTGLGLLLCKEFIHRNGGELRIKSIDREGTEVSFTLMLADKHKHFLS
jgi:two-component system sensor histidine kinase/response regulator